MEDETTPQEDVIAAPVTTDATAPAPVAPKRKKIKRNVASGQLHILATFNNTIVSFTDPRGWRINKLQCWCLWFQERF